MHALATGFRDFWRAARRPSAACRRPAAAGTARRVRGLPAARGVPGIGPGEARRQAIGAGLIVHRADPLNAETPLAALDGAAVVPNGQFYVRNHFPVPDLDAGTWRLQVGGMAGRPLALSLAE